MAYSKYLDNSELAEKINLARGRVLNTSFIHKFGAVPAMSQNQTGTVWDVNDTLYPWSALDTPGVLNIPAVNVLDNNDRVRVYGLDENYKEINEEFTLSSTLTVTGTKTFSRVYRAYYFDNTTNAGNIDIRRNTTVVARISAGKAQTLMSIYTVPAGYTGYLMQGTCTVQGGADASGNMFVRYFGQNSFRVGHAFEVSGNGGQYMYDFSVPIPLPEKTDIDVRASVRSNNARVTAAFDIILVKGTK